MSLLTLDIEKAAAGGRMLARHNGRIVLVAGAIPGERVSARLERTERGVMFAEVAEVLQPSVDRRSTMGDARCGGNVFAHIEYPRQLRLKGEIIEDAFRRIGRLPLPEPPPVTGSPERGYRMRARLHVSGGKVGFYLEGTHQVCDPGTTGQLLPETYGWIAAAQRTLDAKALRDVAAIEIAENIPGQERGCHLELHANAEPSTYAAIAEGLVAWFESPAHPASPTRFRQTTIQHIGSRWAGTSEPSSRAIDSWSSSSSNASWNWCRAVRSSISTLVLACSDYHSPQRDGKQ
jgi:predicted RNA-binding protein with TRAM domain